MSECSNALKWETKYFAIFNTYSTYMNGVQSGQNSTESKAYIPGILELLTVSGGAKMKWKLAKFMAWWESTANSCPL